MAEEQHPLGVRPLDGIRVVDTTTGIAGPMATMFLADFGADVVKVEPPDGDPARANPGFAMWNRNKRSVMADVAEAEGRSRLEDLLRGADIAVFGETSDVLTAKGLDPESVQALNPRLIYLHTPPFDGQGPTPWAGDHESAALLAAETGIAAGQYAFEEIPIESVYPHALYGQAIWAAGAATAALIEREGSGQGQTVTVGGLHGMMMTMTGQLTVVPSLAGNRKTGGGPGGPVPWYRLYECADGEWIFLACLTPKFYMKAFEVLDVFDMLTDERLAGEPAMMMTPDNIDWVLARLRAALKSRTRADWMERLNSAGCPTAYAGRREDWLADPQSVATGMRLELADPERGAVVMPGLSLNLTKTPGAVTSPAPTLGADNALEAWSPQSNAPAAATGETKTGPLAGRRILDLGTIIAGTYAGSLLAELGADVIKVEALTGDPLRSYGPTFVGYNKGKRGLAIDLRSETGREAFYGLVKRADAVVDNYRPGVLGRLGIDYDSLIKVNPGIITASVTGFGEGGPDDDKPGMDPMLQAMSGMMHAQGGDSEPVFFTLPVNDVSSASMATLGILLSIFHRQRTGEGQRVWTSLAGQSAMMQAGELVDYPGRPPAPLGGRDFQGASALDRFYETSDGWLRIEASGGDLPSLRDAGLLGTNAVEDDDKIAKRLGAALKALTQIEALRRLADAGVPAAAARPIASLPTAGEFEGTEVSHFHQPETGEPFWTAGRYARFSRTERADSMFPPGLGEHTRAALAEAGLEADAIDQMLRDGIVVESGPFSLG
jgi:crotonobetainyl-CoA:carnitine CoA-transferase CaiB-like acyl-CoA transferase